MWVLQSVGPNFQLWKYGPQRSSSFFFLHAWMRRGESETLGTNPDPRPISPNPPRPHLPQSPCVPLSSPLLSIPSISVALLFSSPTVAGVLHQAVAAASPSDLVSPSASIWTRSSTARPRWPEALGEGRATGARWGERPQQVRREHGAASTAPRARRCSMARPRWPEALGEGRATGSCQPTSRATSPAPPSPPLQSTSPARPSSPAEARSPPVRYLSCNLVVLGIAFFSTRPRCVGCLPPYPRFLIFFIWPLFLPWFCSDEEQGNFCLQWRGALT